MRMELETPLPISQALQKFWRLCGLLTLFRCVLVSLYGSHTEAGLCTLPSLLSAIAAAAATGSWSSADSMLISSGFFSSSGFSWPSNSAKIFNEAFCVETSIGHDAEVAVSFPLSCWLPLEEYHSLLHGCHTICWGSGEEPVAGAEELFILHPSWYRGFLIMAAAQRQAACGPRAGPRGNIGMSMATRLAASIPGGIAFAIAFCVPVSVS